VHHSSVAHSHSSTSSFFTQPSCPLAIGEDPESMPTTEAPWPHLWPPCPRPAHGQTISATLPLF
jgi:hypothetical protein